MRLPFSAISLAAFAALGVSVCLAQSNSSGQNAPAPTPAPAPCTVAPQPDPCGATPTGDSKQKTMEKFPFPGGGSGSSASPSAPAADAPAPSLTGTPAAPDANGEKPDAAKQFPFPGDVKPGGGTEAGTSSSSSSSSGDDSYPGDAGTNPDGSPALKDSGSEGNTPTPGRHILHRVNPVATKLQSPDEREAEDLQVAGFYRDSGDLQGAYLRSQDAVKAVPDDPDAHFALAEIALKLNKRDEAIAEYNACLKLDPTDKQAKDARKALEKLQH